MTQVPTSATETLETNENLPFAEQVRAEYERIVPEGTRFDWYKRAESFVSQGTQTLWKEYQTASNTEKIVLGGVAVVGAYVGLKLLKAAVDAVFDLGKWMMEKITSIRKDSIELILKLTLGAAAVALVPVLYEAIAKGKLSLADITQTWDADGAKGVIALIASKFPEGISSMSEDAKQFIIGIIGADRFKELFELPETPPVEAPDGETPSVSGTEESDSSWLTEDTQQRLNQLKQDWSAENFERFISALIDNEGGIVVDNGKIWFLDSLGDFKDLGHWLQLQYFSSVREVIEAGERDPEEQVGAYIQQYLREVPKFWVVASSLEFINLLRGKHASFVVRPAINALTWGAWPLKLIGPAAKLITGDAAYARFTRNGVVFLTKSGANLAKLTAQGSVLVWKGGQFVLSQVARQTARLSLAKTIGAMVTRTYTGTIGRKVAHFTGQSFMKRLFAIAGWKGAAAAALWADDATVIGILDDIVAVGLTAWLVVDVHDLIKITRRAMIFKSTMAEQQALEITNIEGLDEATETKLAELESDENFDEGAATDLFTSMAKAEFRITRSNGVSEEYIMVRGKIISVKVVENGVTIAEFSEEDVEKLSEELPPPQQFKAWEIDYNQDKETLISNYRLVFNFVVNETGWSELAYDIVDENRIIIKRRTTEQSIEITRRGNQWFIGEDDQTAFDLFQAVSLANLINRVEMVILNQNSMPSGDAPFYANSDGVYVSRLGFDTTILEGEEDSWYTRFYQSQLDLNPDLISKTLNTHYQNYIKSRLSDQIDDYMKDFIPG